MVMRVVAAVLVAIVLALGALAAVIYRPDLPLETIERDYGDRLLTEHSTFLGLEPGLRVHYRDEGVADAPVIVLLHGSNSSLQTWEPWVARLSKTERLISLDLPGHGLTGPAPDGDYSDAAMDRFVDAFTKKLGLSQFVLAGHSMGGGIAWRYAVNHPERVSRLILVAASGLPPLAKQEPSLVFRLARTPVVRDLMTKVSLRPLIKGALLDAYGDKRFVTEALIERYEILQRRAGNRAASLARLNLPRAYPLAGKLGSIAAPTLVLWGSEDKLVPVGDAARFGADIKSANVIVYPGIGHMVQEEAADESAAAVATFLANAPLAGAGEEATGALPREGALGPAASPLAAAPIGAVDVQPLAPPPLPSAGAMN